MFYPHTIKGKPNFRDDIVALQPLYEFGLDLSTQYLELQGSTSRLDLGTKTLAFSTWFYYDGVNSNYLLNKYNSLIDIHRYVVILDSAGKLRTTIHISGFANSGNTHYDAPNTLSVGWHHMVYYWDRTDVNTPPKVYVDGVENTDGFLVSSVSDPTGVNITNNIPTRMGGFQGNPTFNSRRAGVFMGVALDQPLTQADATYLYNGGVVPCWPGVLADNPTLYNKFDEVFDLAVFNGSSELDGLTGRVNEWILTNVNNAPLNSIDLNINCN